MMLTPREGVVLALLFLVCIYQFSECAGGKKDRLKKKASASKSASSSTLRVSPSAAASDPETDCGRVIIHYNYTIFFILLFTCLYEIWHILCIFLQNLPTNTGLISFVHGLDSFENL